MDTMSEILDVKGRTVHCIDPQATVLEAVTKMCAEKVGCLLVRNEERPVGTFTERDLMTRVILVKRLPHETLVYEVMSPTIVTVQTTTDVREAMKLMTDQRCRHLPVLGAGKIIGIVSIGDLVRWSSLRKDDELFQLKDTALI